ncbi:MAG: PhzF family phenazine biosynthesis isomerase [Steroidobacteraceae bacterium]
MNEDIRIFQVDAFTQHAFTGNPAGVVLGADALSSQQMQQLARELNNGDTVFALAANGTDHDLQARFFTPRTEAGFVGHATLALHAVLTQIGGARTRRQKHRNGSATVLPVPGTTPTQFAIRQPPPLLGGAPEPTMLASVLQGLGLRPEQLDSRCPPQFAGANNARLLLGVDNGASIAALRPDLAQLAQISAAGGAAGYFIFTLAPQTRSDVESRMFCPALGINEDPVSGNAHGMLAAYLLARGLLSGLSLRGAQGHHMGRGGEVEIALTLRGSVLELLEIRGSALVLFEARMSPGVLR